MSTYAPKPLFHSLQASPVGLHQMAHSALYRDHFAFMKGSAGLTFSALKQIYNAVFDNKALETSFKTNITGKYCIVYILGWAVCLLLYLNAVSIIFLTCSEDLVGFSIYLWKRVWNFL